MSINLEKIYNDAMRLPDESKALLAERLVDYLQSHISPALEKIHIDTVNERRDEVESGKIMAINGREALERARRMLEK